MKRFVLLAAVVAHLAGTTISAQTTRRIYMRVLNPNGITMTDITPADVTVTENGVPQKVTKLALSSHPMRIVLLVDTSKDSQFEIQDLRAGLSAFIGAVPAPHELMLVTTGQNVRVVVQPTVDRKKMTDAVGRLFAAAGGTLLYDAITEVDNRFVKKAGDLSPVVVIVTGDGTESSQRYDDRAFTKFSQDLGLRGVPVHALIFSRGAIKAPGALSLNLARTTQSHGEAFAVSSALPEKLTTLATAIVDEDQQLAMWYEVDYVSTSKEPRPAIAVSISSRTGATTELTLTRRLP